MIGKAFKFYRKCTIIVLVGASKNYLTNLDLLSFQRPLKFIYIIHDNGVFSGSKKYLKNLGLPFQMSFKFKKKQKNCPFIAFKNYLKFHYNCPLRISYNDLKIDENCPLRVSKNDLKVHNK